MKKIKGICKGRILAFVLALVMGVTFIPLMGSQVYADEDTSMQAQGDLQALGAITAAPSNSLSMYEVYSTYYFFSTGAFPVYYNLYMEYRPAGGAWKTFGSMGYYQNYTISGLSPNTTYQVRLYYTPTYTGSALYGYSGKGPYSATVTFRTGPKAKPAIKSAKVKAIKVKKHKQKVYGYYTGLYLGKRTYYTYKLKTTVKLKKAPGTPGFNLNGKRFKGNKKSYTVTTGKLIRYYSKPKGKTYKVTAYTYQNYQWLGASLLYSKNCKIK